MINAERVNKLTDVNYEPKFIFLNKKLFFGLGSIIFIILLGIVLLTDTSEAFEMHNSGSCIENLCNLNNKTECLGNDETLSIIGDCATIH